MKIENKAQKLARLLGGKSALARVCEVTPGMVTRWCKSGEIPHKYNMRLKRAIADFARGQGKDVYETTCIQKEMLECLYELQVCPHCGQPIEGRRAI